MAQKGLLFSSVGITLSGAILLSLKSYDHVMILKLFSALLLFYLFFSCPTWQQKLSKRAGALYRLGVVILLLLTLALALII
jgi:hypothetical protein